ncbi:DUF4173 domain-containing protein [Algibacter miyuki]|uniref:DUF4173 domain-containing protein n=1 Tax=Algibacter miyuki TaxID=1306933 RepID=A0ABV5GYS9_9FLAO|nr:DUF4173 domain-containing protein [Algibacter miyuki]MDN3665916.1 DUF4173 domain-containing protein [Algibacter miyuki]
MKNIPLIIGALLFSTLFYKQSIGLNLSLFTVLTILLLVINNKKFFKHKSTLLLSLVYIITAVSVFIFQSQLAIIANIIAFFTIIGHVSEHESSIYINWLNGIYTTIAGFFERNLFANPEHPTPSKKNIDYLHLAKIIGIPLLVVIIFIGLYRNGNPVFSDFIAKIDFSFFNLNWFLLAALGYYLFYNISTPLQVNPITEKDLSIGNFLKNTGNPSEESLKKENQLGLILMVLLNVLILLFLITDIAYLASIDTLNAPELSNQVHSGIYALIASILMAIVIILWFFRGDLNFYKNNQTLKTLAYTWIALNLIMVFSIGAKNYHYIASFGFTYKRIGVFVYLLLTLIGLSTTVVKVYKIKNLWYLFRVNTQLAFVILIMSCAFNWDGVITHYNLNYSKTTDVSYLINLSNNNTFILKSYSNNTHLNASYKHKVDKKLNTYIEMLNQRDWQEWSFDNFKTTVK